MKSVCSKNAINGKSILNSAKNIITSKNFICFALLSCVFISGIFAQESIEALDNWGNKILAIFSSGWIKALACVALIIEAIGMIVAGQQGGGGAIIKKFAPWIIGTIILLSASGITGYFLDNLNFEEMSLLPESSERIECLV